LTERNTKTATNCYQTFDMYF